MKIFNYTNYDISLNILEYTLPTIVKSNSISADFHPSADFLNFIITNFSNNEIILIPLAFHDKTICSTIAHCNEYIKPYGQINYITPLSNDKIKKLNIIDNTIIIDIPLNICMDIPISDEWEQI